MSIPKTSFPQTRASLLLQLKSASDEAAWADFVAVYQPVIYRIARKRGLQHADAQDSTQEILIAVAGSIESFDMSEGTSRFRHWLRTVARNAILNRLTRQPRDQAQGGTGALYEALGPTVGDAELEQELTLERRRELYARAASAVQSEVAADSWRVFQRAVIERVAIEAVARELGKSVGAAYACRGRVMSRLRRTIQRMESES